MSRGKLPPSPKVHIEELTQEVQRLQAHNGSYRLIRLDLVSCCALDFLL